MHERRTSKGAVLSEEPIMLTNFLFGICVPKWDSPARKEGGDSPGAEFGYFGAKTLGAIAGPRFIF
jgi:hypothetical protein